MDIKVIGSGSSGNCCRISDGHTAILLDAGLPYKTILKGCNFSTADVAGALISHSHGDHTKSVRDLAMWGEDIYASPETLKEIDISGVNIHPCKNNKVFPVGSFSVMPFDLHHDVRNFGYLIESIVTHERMVYITDTYYTDYTFPGITHWMIECNYVTEILERNRTSGAVPFAVAKRVLSSHMSLESVCKLFQANDMSTAKEIHLLHISDSNGDESRMKRAVQEIAGCPVYVA